MLNLTLVWGITVRYFYSWRHNLDRLSDSFYWPAMDLLLLGLMSIYIKNQGSFPQVVFVILTGLIFWMVIWRSQYEIAINLLTELWDKNLVNMFATPIRLREWVASVMLLGVIKMVVTLTFASLLAYVLYSYNILIYGYLLLPFFASLLLMGWCIGFLVAGLVIRYGIRIQTLGWVGAYMFAPFSALYYPVSALPNWAQKIAAFTPASYIFEGTREILFNGTFSYDKLFTSFALNGIYMILSILFFVFMFNQSRKLGLGRLIS